jgi:hypothetical protein
VAERRVRLPVVGLNVLGELQSQREAVVYPGVVYRRPGLKRELLDYLD